MPRRTLLVSEVSDSALGDIPSYSFSGLPAAGVAGRLARVSDTDGGLWMDTSLAWSKVSIPINPMDAPFNAKLDGVTDDSAAIQAALTRGMTSGRAVEIPYSTSTTNVYMGTTGITFGGITFRGQGNTALVWSSAFTGTAITMNSHSSYLCDMGLYMPKSVGVPNSSIVAIDTTRIRCKIENVYIGRTSSGNNSPWYTGIKIGDINSSVIDCEIDTYDIGVQSYTASGGSGSRNDIDIRDNIISSQITTVLDFPDTSAVNITGNELNCTGTGLHCIRATSVGAGGTEGFNVTGNYLTGCTGVGSAGILIDASGAGQTGSGVHIAGNIVYTSNAVSAIRLKNTSGSVVTGNELWATTYSLYLGTPNTAYTYASNTERNGAVFGFDGTINPDFHPGYVGTWTPVLKGATTTTYTSQVGKWMKEGRQVSATCSLIVNSLGDGSTTHIDGLPFDAQTNVNFPVSVGFFSGLAGGNFVWIGGNVNAASNEVSFSTMAAAGVTATSSAGVFGNGARVDFSATYFTD